GFFWLPRVLLSENLALPLLLGILCALAMLLYTFRPVWAGILGVLLGLSLLVRGASVFVVVPLLIGFVIFAYRQGAWRQGYLLTCLVLGVMLITLLPWGIRNYLVFHRVVPLSTQDGLTLYSSYWPPRVGLKRIWGNLAGEEDPAVTAAFRTHNEVEVSRYLQSLTFRRLREQPEYFFELLPAKLLSLMAPFDWEWFPHSPGTSRSVNVGYILMLVPALFGTYILVRQPVPHQWLLWVLPISVLVQSLIFYGSPRFRLPGESIVLLLASIGMTGGSNGGSTG
ncbi:MAG: hypothetical protein L0Y56_10185, partial [Nitrospira sp.]|nr:hypothetical protein [Nitrospira sp.]